jgi:hypothetical protein
MLYNTFTSLGCSAWNKTEFKCVEYRVLIEPNYLKEHNAQNHTQNHPSEPKKQPENIQADLSAAVVGALQPDSQCQGYQQIPWTSAINSFSRSQECIVL